MNKIPKKKGCWRNLGIKRKSRQSLLIYKFVCKKCGHERFFNEEILMSKKVISCKECNRCKMSHSINPEVRYESEVIENDDENVRDRC